MACPLHRLIQHQEKPQTVQRGTTELARTLLPPSENPHFMRVSGITCHCNGATSVKVASGMPSPKGMPVAPDEASLRTAFCLRSGVPTGGGASPERAVSTRGPATQGDHRGGVRPDRPVGLSAGETLWSGGRPMRGLPRRRGSQHAEGPPMLAPPKARRRHRIIVRRRAALGPHLTAVIGTPLFQQ